LTHAFQKVTEGTNNPKPNPNREVALELHRGQKLHADAVGELEVVKEQEGERAGHNVHNEALHRLSGADVRHQAHMAKLLPKEIPHAISKPRAVQKGEHEARAILRERSA